MQVVDDLDRARRRRVGVADGVRARLRDRELEVARASPGSSSRTRAEPGQREAAQRDVLGLRRDREPDRAGPRADRSALVTASCPAAMRGIYHRFASTPKPAKFCRNPVSHDAPQAVVSPRAPSCRLNAASLSPRGGTTGRSASRTGSVSAPVAAQHREGRDLARAAARRRRCGRDRRRSARGRPSIATTTSPPTGTTRPLQLERRATAAEARPRRAGPVGDLRSRARRGGTRSRSDAPARASGRRSRCPTYA